jgi:hypothetical protein
MRRGKRPSPCSSWRRRSAAAPSAAPGSCGGAPPPCGVSETACGLDIQSHEVDALGGLHLFRADYVEHDVPAPAGAPNNQPPHDDMNPEAAVHIADAAHD